MLLQLAAAHTVPDFFCTLTYGADYPDEDRAREDWRVTWQRVQRAADRADVRACVVWRLELQRRGAPHVHFLLFQAPHRPRCVVAHLGGTLGPTARAWAHRTASRSGRGRRIVPGGRLDWLATLQAVWAERTEGVCAWDTGGSHNSVDVRSVRGRRAASHYVSKYCAKVDRTGAEAADGAPRPTRGRVWGVRGHRDVLDDKPLAHLTAVDSDAMRDILGRWWASQGNRHAYTAEEECRAAYWGFVSDGAQGGWARVLGDLAIASEAVSGIASQTD